MNMLNRSGNRRLCERVLSTYQTYRYLYADDVDCFQTILHLIIMHNRVVHALLSLWLFSSAWLFHLDPNQSTTIPPKYGSMKFTTPTPHSLLIQRVLLHLEK